MLKPLNGQSKGLGARKGTRPTILESRLVSVAGAGIYTAGATGYLLIYAWGAGGSGAAESGSAGTGGGSGAACHLRVRVRKGQTLNFNVGAGGAGVSAGSDGNAGGDTLVLAAGVTLRAGGGGGGRRGGNMPGGAGGIAYSGDVRRPGAAAADNGSSNYTDGAPPVGWADLFPFLPNGTSSSGSPFSGSAAAVSPGAASGAAGATSGSGGDGRLLFVLIGP
jgi:hypothetical protein